MSFNPPKATGFMVRNPERNLRHKDKTEHEKVYINMGVIFEIGIVILGTKENFFKNFWGKGNLFRFLFFFLS